MSAYDMHMPQHPELVLFAELLLYAVYPLVIKFKDPPASQTFHVIVMRVSYCVFVADIAFLAQGCSYQSCPNKMGQRAVDGTF